MTDSVRLSKHLIDLIGCSRREAQLYIEGGWVLVNGTIIDEPQFPITDQLVELRANAVAEPLPSITLLLNQPIMHNVSLEQQLALLSPATHWAEDPSTTLQLKGHFARLSSELPLQEHATGLQVFTQDWHTLRKLTDDRTRLEQEYVVEVSGEITAQQLKRIAHAQIVNGMGLPSCKASQQNEHNIRMVLKDPSPGVIERLCASIDLKVIAMKRIRIGGVSMGKLPLGQWRYCTATQRF
ncbi:MAG: rRNA pseudouridine synthase [Pseudomonas sp.]|jgi:23S rRNA pseudouridine2604 synthase|nr:rRNA pseudouridine synthase [Pseudomonas sp.]MDD2223003.1 rRNA pseudouridine synthase [Pseudomonas sp.]MDY0414991.1 rRNA pseudouridine synthase [Pseudomonas sp.]NLO53213.1 RNA-binding protein [Gammaproteobacteria bacterium]